MNSLQFLCITLATGLLVVAALLLVLIANQQDLREPRSPASQMPPMQQSVIPEQSVTFAGRPSPQQSRTRPRSWVF
ncbi:hypothetical protein D3C85_1721840 [compost metagenome]